MTEASEPASPRFPRDEPNAIDAQADLPRAPGLDAAVLEEIVRRIVKVAKPNRIIMFGSAARGTMDPNSDIDLLVIKPGVENRRRLAGDIYLQLSGVEVPVDIIVASPEDIEGYGSQVGSVIRPAMREGIEIYLA